MLAFDSLLSSYFTHIFRQISTHMHFILMGYESISKLILRVVTNNFCIIDYTFCFLQVGQTGTSFAEACTGNTLTLGKTKRWFPIIWTVKQTRRWRAVGKAGSIGWAIKQAWSRLGKTGSIEMGKKGTSAVWKTGSSKIREEGAIKVCISKYLQFISCYSQSSFQVGIDQLKTNEWKIWI